MKVIWTRQAVEQLQEIEEFIARDSPTQAIEFVDRLISKGDSAGNHPNRGRIVPEFGAQNIRELIEGHYRIVYRVKTRTVEVLTVFEGHRLFSKSDLE